jgi:hypothetical protein
VRWAAEPEKKTVHNNNNNNNNNNKIVVVVFCHRLFLPGTSLEPAVPPTAQASSVTLQYSPYYVLCSKYSCL